MELYRSERQIVADLARDLHCDAGAILSRVEKLHDTVARLEKEVEAARVRLAQAEIAGILATRRVTPSGLSVSAARIDVRERKDLLTYGDLLRDRMESGAAMLGAVVDGKPALLCVVSQDAVKRGLHAGKIVGLCAEVIGGKGGGRPNSAQAGGTYLEHLDEAIVKIYDCVQD